MKSSLVFMARINSFVIILMMIISSCKSSAPILQSSNTSVDTTEITLDEIKVGNRASLYNDNPFRLMNEWRSPNTIRTGSGRVGKDYWQQRVDYVINAKLDTNSHMIIGTEKITYKNNSPDSLGYLWLQLDQNELNPKMRTRLSEPAADPYAPTLFRPNPFDGGDNIIRVEVIGDKQNAKEKSTQKKSIVKKPLKYLINDTVMRIDLDEAVKSGESVEFEIEWSYVIPFTGRTGRGNVKQGWIYEIAQWYPRLCVYDDLAGWNTDQYLGAGEFYTEFGNFDVSLTVPANHICLATGVLQNSNEVLTKTIQDRLAKAKKSEATVMIIDRDEVGNSITRSKKSGELTWHYKAENVRDFAFASSASFIWDAASWKGILVQSIYPEEAILVWKESTQSLRFSLKFFSENYFPYPYPTMINVNGSVPGGMEYPMMIFCRERFNEYRLFTVTLHEVGHTWFPMITQNNERRYAWMDEGLNSFMCYYGEKEKYPERKARRGEGRDLVPYMISNEHQSLMTAPDVVYNLGQNAYAKTAAALVALRDEVLGAERFDKGFKEYISRWAYKHPAPEDFFRTMEDATGENLGWFWRGWFHTTSQLDQAVTGIDQIDSLDAYYTRIELKNEKEMVMPVKIEIMFDDSTTMRKTLPVEIWRKGKEFISGFFTEEKIIRVTIDPDGKLPDINLDNNVWRDEEYIKSLKRDSTVTP